MVSSTALRYNDYNVLIIMVYVVLFTQNGNSNTKETSQDALGEIFVSLKEKEKHCM